MADIHIHREHRLGLAKARKTAWRWAEAAEAKFGMECTVIEGETSDVVEFTRSGVAGRLVVDAVLAGAAGAKKKPAAKAATKRK